MTVGPRRQLDAAFKLQVVRMNRPGFPGGSDL